MCLNNKYGKNLVSSSKGGIALSLLTLSFLSSFAQGTSPFTGHTYVNTPSTSSKTITKGTTGNNHSGLIWIRDNASVIINNDNNNPAINIANNANSFLFLNEGTLQNNSTIQTNNNNTGVKIGQGHGTANNSTIRYFFNLGTITGGKFGITAYDDNNNKNASIQNFVNRGFISGGEAGIDYKINTNLFANTGSISASGSNSNSNGIWLGKNITINTFYNSGTINANKAGIVNKSSSINTFVNTGSIRGNKFGIEATYADNNKNASIQSFVNKGIISGGEAGIDYKINTNLFVNTGSISATNSGNGSNGIWLGKDNSIMSISNFINTGSISGHKSAIVSQAHISNFINMGILEGRDKNSNITTYGEEKHAILIKANTSISNFYNSGTIKANNPQAFHNAIEVEGSASLSNFYNTGTIEGAQALYLKENAKLSNFINTGLMQSISTANNSSYKLAAVYVGEKLTMDYFFNTGTIKGVSGIVNAGTVTNLVNTGTIEATSKADFNGAIKIVNFKSVQDGQVAQTGIIYNEGVLKSSSNGILTETGNSTATIINAGTIEAKKDGIVFFKDSYTSIGDEVNTGKVILKENSTIKAGRNGINLDFINGVNNKNIKATSIEVKAGAKIDAEGAAIRVGKDKKVNTQIIIAGDVKGGAGAIVNEGSIGEELNPSGSSRKKRSTDVDTSNVGIVIKEGASISGGIVNEAGASISGGIVNNSASNISLSNKGTISASANGDIITNNGTGSVEVKEWALRSDDSGGLQTLRIGGSGASKVYVENLTVDQSNLDVKLLDDTANLVSGVDTKNIKNIQSNGGGELKFSFDPKSGRLSTDIVLNASIAGAIFRNLNTAGVKRGALINGVLNNTMGSLDTLGRLSNAQKLALNKGDSKAGYASANTTGAYTYKESAYNTYKVNKDSTYDIAKGEYKYDKALDYDKSLGYLEYKDSLNKTSSLKGYKGGLNDNYKVNKDSTYDIAKGEYKYDKALDYDRTISSRFNNEGSDSKALASNLYADASNILASSNIGEASDFLLAADTTNTRNILPSSRFNSGGSIGGSALDYRGSLGFNTGLDQEIKEHAFMILPYFSSLSTELSLNEESKGHTKGVISAYSTLKESGIYGLYAGYEDTSMESTYFDVKNRTYYGGLRYFTSLYGGSLNESLDYELYLRAGGKAAFIKNNVLKKIDTNKAGAKPNTYAYGANVDMGLNFILDSHVFSPELGLVYEGSYTKAYTMNNLVGGATVHGGERMYKNQYNLFSTKASVTWFEDWLPHLKTSLELGAKFNLNPTITFKGRFGSRKASEEIELASVEGFLNAALILPLNPSFYMSLNYSGMSSSKDTIHTGFAQFSYLW